MDDSNGKLNKFEDIPNPFEHRIYLNKWQKLQVSHVLNILDSQITWVQIS